MAPRRRRNEQYAFYHGIGAELGLSDPVFQKRLQEEGINPKKDPEAAGALWIDNVWHGRAWSWEKIPWLIRTWKEISGGKPFLIKGIQSVADAMKCVDVGCDGIVVSNHAGRQVDGAIASLDALENIINAGVGEKLVVTFDSGVRGGTDIIKALAIGAKFVFIGRLWIWGLSIMGEHGVRHVMKGLLADLDIAMCVAGIRNIGEIDRTLLGKSIQLNYRIQLIVLTRIISQILHAYRGKGEALKAGFLLQFSRLLRISYRSNRTESLNETLCHITLTMCR